MTDTERRTAMWRATLALLGLAVIGTAASIVLWKVLEPGVVPLWAWGIALGVEIVFIVLLVGSRLGSRQVLLDVTFLAAAACLYWAAWLTNGALARAGSEFEAFEAFKLAAIAIALVAPPRPWVGVLCIVAAGALAGIEFAIWPVPLRAAVPAVEPWSTLVYAAIALGIYAFRLRAMDLRLRAVRAEAEAEATRRVARTLAAAGDLANTPLQTIELTLPLLRSELPDSARDSYDRLERAVEGLRGVSDLLRRHGADVDAQPDDHSFDAQRRLTGRASESRASV